MSTFLRFGSMAGGPSRRNGSREMTMGREVVGDGAVQRRANGARRSKCVLFVLCSSGISPSGRCASGEHFEETSGERSRGVGGGIVAKRWLDALRRFLVASASSGKFAASNGKV